jgi:hypothetical protein
MFARTVAVSVFVVVVVIVLVVPSRRLGSLGGRRLAGGTHLFFASRSTSRRPRGLVLLMLRGLAVAETRRVLVRFEFHGKLTKFSRAGLLFMGEAAQTSLCTESRESCAPGDGSEAEKDIEPAAESSRPTRQNIAGTKRKLCG